MLAAVAALFAVSLALPAHSAPASPRPEVAEWQSLLDQYCIRLPGKAPLQDTRFDYEQLYVDEKIWTLKRSERLERARQQLLSVNPATLTPHERVAWALNTCNFLVVEQMTLHLLVPGRQFLRYKSVHDVLLEGAPFFEGRIVTVEGRALSIEEFARRYVYGDSTPLVEPRATPGDPRWLLAFCRGHVGGAPLAPRAFRADSLEAQLDLCARRAFAQPRFVMADPRTGVLSASDLLASHALDFGGDLGRVVPFLARYGSGDVPKTIQKFKLATVTRFMQVDPLLNQFDRPKQAPPGQAPPPSRSSM
ncbi:MAG: hypothetical protein U0704_05495 [Candidatus Eisenbacteria bacterium]